MKASKFPPPGSAPVFDAIIAAKVKAATLQDLVADMRGARLDATAIKFVERRESHALDFLEIVEQSFPSRVSDALNDFDRSIHLVCAAEKQR